MESPDPRIEASRHAIVRAVVILATLAAVTALWIGRELFVPFSLALVVATVLRPLVRRLERLRMPAPAAAAAVVLVTLGLLIGLGFLLETPVRTMATDAPNSIAKARAKLDAMGSRLSRLTAGTTTTSVTSPQSAAPRVSTAAASGSAASGPPSAAMRSVFTITASLLTEIVEEVLLVFFLLAAGNRWMTKLARMTRSPHRSTLWPEIAGEMHDVVSRYLVVTLFINIGQAIIIGLATWALGLSSPFLWGTLTFVAEFVPYLGGIVMIGLLLVTGLAGDQSFARALLAPGIYLVVTTLQNNLVSPVAYGRRLRLNPTMILLAVMFFWLIWGVAGAFLAVPILASLRVIGSRVPRLHPVAVLLEE
jgi:predicted PurR-regulated permease PerM